MIAQGIIRDGLVDFNNATVTSQSIIASEFFHGFGFVSELLMLVCDMGVAAIRYLLLRDISRILSFLSSFFRLSIIIIISIVAMTHYTALFFFKDTEYLKVFNPEQIDALALLSNKIHGAGDNISFLFGIHLIILAYLVKKFAPFPRTIGILLFFAGLCYVSNILLTFLFPSVVSIIYAAILIPCFAAELTLIEWLIWKGMSATSTLLPE